MPTYSFKCACGHEFDQYHCLADIDKAATCPKCRGSARRQFTPGTILMPCSQWPKGTWADNTNEDFAPDPDRQLEYSKRIFPIGGKRTGNRMRF